MSKFGWCMSGKHKDDCKFKVQRFYIGTKKVKRKSVQAIIWLDEWNECSCSCHTEPVGRNK